MRRMWWGYLHVSGSIQAKPYFGDLDIIEAFSSPFVKMVVREPFEADGYDDAVRFLKKEFKVEEKPCSAGHQ